MSEKLENENNKSFFVRFLIVVLVLFIAAMIAYAFYMPGEYRAKISSGIITLLCLAVILSLSEAFDNFSIAKIFEISRESKKKDSEIKTLEEKNEKLFDYLVNLSVSQKQSQSQNSTYVHGHYHAAPVRAATDEEVEAANQVKAEQASVTSPGTTTAESSGSDSATTNDNAAHPERTIAPLDWRKLETLAIDKHIQRIASGHISVIRDAKLVSQFSGVDPISTARPIFDGFAKDLNREIFMEVRNSKSIGISFRDDLYVKLSKIFHYRNTRKVEAHMDLILIKSPSDKYNESSLERLYDQFAPAINENLLKICEIAFTDEEIEACRKSSAIESN
jgi:hypothetical protein